jgi:tRNA-splicing ligase RtcB
MEGTSVILEGVESELSQKGLYSTVHGAGRTMSRRKAAGKRKWVKGKKGRRYQKQVSPGVVNFRTVQDRLRTKGIVLRGAAADEAPECYKELDDVLEAQKNTIKVLHRLRPIGVAMAGAETYDPYKD